MTFSDLKTREVQKSDVFGYLKTQNPGGKPYFFGTSTRQMVPELDLNPTFGSFCN